MATQNKKTRKSTVQRKKKASAGKQYKVKNWSNYNDSLVQRGSITFWFNDETIKNWCHANDQTKVGRPFIYSDGAILAVLAIRELFRLAYRQTEGLARSLFDLMQIDVPIPDYTSLAKRAAKLSVSLDAEKRESPIDVVVDSTGLKVFGEGEWKVRKHGWGKRRTWIKLHLAVDADSREIVAEVTTESSDSDGDQVGAMLEQIDSPVNDFLGDGAYDQWKVYAELESIDAKGIIPPRKGAAIKQHGNCSLEPLDRDESLREIRRVGEKSWKESRGYHRRSLAETAMYRMKQIFGGELKNRKFETQQIEARLRCKILNAFTQIGMPVFEWG